MWNSIRLCYLTGKTLHPVAFYTIQLLTLYRNRDFLANLKLQVAETIFWNF